MPRQTRDHSMLEMMVVPATAVECAAKIAMTTLRGVAAAMALLPIHQLSRFIFLGRRRCEFVNLAMSTPIALCMKRDRSKQMQPPATIELSTARPAE
jgi:hypothetical protein